MKIIKLLLLEDFSWNVSFKALIRDGKLSNTKLSQQIMVAEFQDSCWWGEPRVTSLTLQE